MEQIKLLINKLNRIEFLLLKKKKLLSVKELSWYTGWSESHIYKLTSGRKIPHYKEKEGAKTIHFKRKEIDKFLTAYEVKTMDERLAAFQNKKYKNEKL